MQDDVEKTEKEYPVYNLRGREVLFASGIILFLGAIGSLISLLIMTVHPFPPTSHPAL